MNNSEIDDMQNNEQEIRTNRQKNSELVADIKEEKTKLYMIEKEDRTLMEKIKFL